MKILVSAIACNPYLGSENYFGWSAVRALANDHELWVLTSKRNLPDLARAAQEGMVPPSLHFVEAGVCRPWHPNRLRARLQDWREYQVFARDSLPVARALHQREKFDLVHHITFTTSRVPLPIWRLGLPFVFGPICGNEEFPFRLFPILSFKGALFELVRKTSNLAGWYAPAVRQTLRQAAHVFAITQEAVRLAEVARGSGAGISQLSPGFYTAGKIAEFARGAQDKNINGTLRLYAAGNLGGQKCIALAFQALKLVKAKGVDFRYHLGASGTEIPHLKMLAARLGLTREIIFGGGLSREDYLRELASTHVYLLPSMRETVGLTMLEAMLAGAVPVVGDNGGPRMAVTADCGYKIPVAAPAAMAAQIADVILTIDRDRQIIRDKGARASARVSIHYTEEHYRREVNAVYQALTQKRGAARS